ncbi:MAG: sigma-70 family RNA polymerase sigma factor [Acidobacteria bacterium]|nr:sigma-70 family RNA polymerase sigma factor [Acidobacteriota bacterium]
MELALPGLILATEPSVSPEVALVRRAQRGEQEAFREIVQRYQGKVFSIIHGILRNRNDAEDIAQQVFTKIYFSLGKFDFRSALVTWIYKITVNECYDYLRKQKVRKLTFESDLSEDDLRRIDNTEDVRRNPAADVDRQTELREIVVRLLDRLSAEERQLLILKEVEGYPVEELAHMLSMNENTVKVKLFRARQKLVKVAKKTGLMEHRTGS